MEAYLLDWANLLLRWAHIITAIAWIGASFHFVLLDNSLYKPSDPELLGKGVDGEAWAVHGGGFYHSNKYFTAPKNLPDKLTAVTAAQEPASAARRLLGMLNVDHAASLTNSAPK